MKTELEVREEILKVSKRLYARNMLSAADGNISYRIDDETILMTPSGRAKAFIELKDIAVLNLKGDVLSGTPSSERSMHLAIYQNCPKAKAIVHAHPPHAIAWSVARPDLSELPAECLSEVILAAGRIPIVPFARPTTANMGDSLLPFLPQSRALILARHGAVTWGEDFDEATNGMERIENSAEILAIAHKLGGLTPLPEEEIVFLRRMRARFGERLL